MTGQLSFDWPTGVALGPDDFFVSAANTQAFAMLQAPDTWPLGKLAIIGPQGCGKSHLARIVQQQTGGDLLHASTLAADYQPTADTIIIEDMQTLPQTSEEAVFHLHNHLQNTRGLLLMTAQTAPTRWPIVLPDLASRMQATTIAQIDDPDDALLQALIMKLFADRQIAPKPDLVAYLAPRVERSFAAAAAIVDQLDRAALDQGRKINTGLARDLLDNAG